MIATVMKASKPSRKTMTSAGSMVDGVLFPELGGLGDHLDAVGSVGRFTLPPACVADAENLQVVKGGSEFLLVADLVLPRLEHRVVELDDGAAGRADEMVVVGVSDDVLVVVVVLAE